MEYKFSDDGFLEIQQIQKCDMAFFYNRTPQAFRKELKLAGIFVRSANKWFYTTTEVAKIFKHFQPVSKADVENAQNRINEYRIKEQIRNAERNEKPTDSADSAGANDLQRTLGLGSDAVRARQKNIFEEDSQNTSSGISC